MIKINGQKYDFEDKNLKEFLDENGYVTTHIAVEINEEIISKADYENTILHSGDVVEIVTFMGGGC